MKVPAPRFFLGSLLLIAFMAGAGCWATWTAYRDRKFQQEKFGATIVVPIIQTFIQMVGVTLTALIAIRSWRVVHEKTLERETLAQGGLPAAYPEPDRT